LEARVEQPESWTEDLGNDFLSGEGLRGVQARPHEHAGAESASMSVREFEYRGRQARIETTYRITIDGEPLRGHVEVLPDGAVHYHPFPQYAPRSAVDVVKAVIDTVWDKPAVPDELGDASETSMHGSRHEHGGQP